MQLHESLTAAHTTAVASRQPDECGCPQCIMTLFARYTLSRFPRCGTRGSKHKAGFVNMSVPYPPPRFHGRMRWRVSFFVSCHRAIDDRRGWRRPKHRRDVSSLARQIVTVQLEEHSLSALQAAVGKKMGEMMGSDPKHRQKQKPGALARLLRSRPAPAPRHPPPHSFLRALQAAAG